MFNYLYSDGNQSNQDSSIVDGKLKSIIKIEFIMNELVESIDKEIQSLKNEIENLSQPILSSVIDEKQEEINEEKKKLEILFNMKFELGGITSLETEKDSLGNQINDLHIQLKNSGNEGYTNSEFKELISNMNNLKNEYKEIENSYENKRRERDEIQSKITELQFRANSLKEKRLKIAQSEASLVETVKAIKQTDDDIKSLKSDITERERHINLIQNELDDLKLNKGSKMKEITLQKTEADTKWSNINEQYIECGRIKKTITNDKIDTDAVYELKIKIDDVIKQEQAIIKEIESLEQHIEQIKKALLDISSGDKRVEMFRKGKKLKEEIIVLKEKIKEFRKFEDEIKEVRERKKRLSEQKEEISGKYNKDQGYLFRLKDDKMTTKLELKKPGYKDITKNLADKEVRYTLSKLMAQEITEKHDVTEKALMMFHHEKMKEINKTISDFWRITYKGDDIDTIEIKSDQEKDEGNSRLRSYNYRIVMKTHDGTEVDMRGRCSAGQKVLGSIIIRLALAETFCSNCGCYLIIFKIYLYFIILIIVSRNCGVLALDEPTTNLDAFNIGGLVEALSNILEEKKDDNNFQLIIITHDQEFINLIAKEHCDCYWKVSKNEKGYSTISKQEIAELNV